MLYDERMKFKPCAIESQCWDGEASTSRCWISLWFQIGIGVFFVMCHKVIQRLSRRIKFESKSTKSHSKNNNPVDTLETDLPLHSIVEEEDTEDIFPTNPDNHDAPDTYNRNEKHKAFYNNGSFRTLSNFTRDNFDESINYPLPYSPEYIPLGIKSSTDFFGIMQALRIGDDVKSVFIRSLGFSLIASSLGTFLSLLLQFEAHTDNEQWTDWIVGFQSGFKTILDSYKFLPIFLMVGYINFIVERWRAFLTNCHGIQGTIHNIGMLCGGSVSTPVSPSTRQKLFKIYRFLNLVHAMCLQSMSPTLKDLSLETDFVEKLQLLTYDEMKLMKTMDNKMRDGAIALLTNAVLELNKAQDPAMMPIGDPSMVEILKSVGALRGKCSALHDLFVRDQPNQYLIAMQFFVGNYCFMLLFGYPFVLLDNSKFLACLQPLTFIGTFFAFLSLQIPFALMNSVRNPFKYGDSHSGIESDNLLASTERALFQSMRCQFHVNSTNLRTSLRRNRMMKNTTMMKSFKGQYGEL